MRKSFRGIGTGFAVAFGTYTSRKTPSRSTKIDFALDFFSIQTPRPSGFAKLANEAYDHLRFRKILKILEIRPKKTIFNPMRKSFRGIGTGFAVAFGTYISRKKMSRSTKIDFALDFFQSKLQGQADLPSQRSLRSAENSENFGNSTEKHNF